MKSTETFCARTDSFDEEHDVIVVGYGFAGATAAIAVSDAGARVLLLDEFALPIIVAETRELGR